MIARFVTGIILLTPLTFVATNLAVPAHAVTGAEIVNEVGYRKLVVRAGPGVANRIVLDQQNGAILVRDSADAVSPGTECAAVDQHTARCPLAETERVLVYGADGDDIITSNVALAPSNGEVVLEGGPGNDLLAVGPTGSQAFLLGGEGNDTHRGGPGNDRLDGGPGPDGFYGGGGIDKVLYWSRTAPVVADLDGELSDDGEAGERDTIMTDVEGLTGGLGNDLLTGNANGNVLDGRGGRDTVTGLAGNDTIHGDGADLTDDDRLDGGHGHDEIFGEGGNDLLRGGPGIDRLTGGFGDDTLDGGPGGVFEPDALDLDDLSGGFGVDAVDYSKRTSDLWVTIDDLANDGEQFEGDNVRTDVETVWAGSGSDNVTAAVPNWRGDVFGGAGDDTINVQDGDLLDTASGDAGHDECFADSFIERRTTCE